MNIFHVKFLFISIGVLLMFCSALEISTADTSAVQKDDYRLPTTIEPISYNISIKPDYPERILESDETSTFSGIVIIKAVVKQATDTVILHAGKIKIDSFNIISESTQGNTDTPEYNETTEQLKIKTDGTLKPGEDITITIIYKGSLRNDMKGFYKSSYIDSEYKEKSLGVTQFQLTHARHVFPCFDEPRFKAKFTIHIGAIPSYKCLSNMPLSEGPTEDDSWFNFHESVPMSSYLVAFVISKFESNGNDKIKVWTRPEAVEQTDYALDIASKSLKFFENLFNLNYQIPKLDMVAVPDFSGGAMENWGLITFREMRLLYDEEDSSIIAKQNIASIITHEITHMWFGNLVSPEWWGYLWLSEAFAQYYHYVVTNTNELSWSMDKQFVIEELQAALRVDAIETSKPMTRYPNSLEDVSKMSDTITYSKGASIIRMMNFIFGQKNFLQALKNYLKTKSNDVATPDDLWQSFQKVIDENNVKLDAPVKTIMETWTDQPGYPVIHVSIDEKGIITLEQERFLIRNSNDISTKTKWHVPLTWTTFNEIQQSNFESVETKLWLTSDVEKTNIKINSTDCIIFNIQQSGFYRVRYDINLWNRIFTVLKSKQFEQVHELNRAAIVDDLLNLARAGLLDYTIALDGLKYIEQETNYLPIKSAINGLRYLQRRFAGQPFESLFNKFVLNLFKNTYTKLRDADKQSDSHFLILLKHELNDLACKLNDADCVNNSKQRFSAWRNSHKKIDVNQRPAVYCAAIREGTVEDWEFLSREAFESNVASDQLVMLEALGCTKDKSLLKRYLDSALTSYKTTKIHQQDRLSLFAAVSGSSLTSAEYVLDYVDENKDKIIAFGGKDAISSILTNTAQYLSTKDLVNKFESLIEKHKVDFASILSSLKDAWSLAKYDLEWYEKNERVIVNWINDYSRSYRLPSSILPNKYIIAITPNVEEGYFHGVLEMSAEIKEVTYEIVLHAENINYISAEVFVNKAVENFEIKESKKYDFWILHLNRRLKIGSELYVKISYSGTLMHKDLRGFYKISYKDDSYKTRYVATTHLEPTGARRLFPCLDEPAFKAIFQLKVNTLENEKVLSNMPMDIKANPIVDRRWITFQETPKMSTFLVAIVISDFECLTDETRHYSVCGRSNVLNAANYTLPIMGKLIKHNQDFLDSEYKLPKLDMVTLPDFSLSSTKNWGLLTFEESKLINDPEEWTTYIKLPVTYIISYGIAHQWFGNLVTPTWWSYLWLSEGFARYFEYFGTECVSYELSVIEDQFVVDQIQPALIADASLSSQPMNYHVEKPSEITSKFNSISYAKAASIIHMVEKVVEISVFYAALQNYIKSRKYDVATPDHLYDEFNKLTKDNKLGYNFGNFMNSWTSQAGYPVVHVSFAKNYKTATLKQERFLLKHDEKPSKDSVWFIPITWASKSKPNFEDVEVSDMMTETSKTIDLDKILPEDWVIFNIGQTGFYRVNYDEDHWQRIINLLKSDDFKHVQEITRASLIDDLMNLGRAGKIDYRMVLNATEYLVKERNYAPWHTFFNGAKYLQKRFAYQDTDDLFKKHISETLQPIYKLFVYNNKFYGDHIGIDYYNSLIKKLVIEWACNLEMNNNCVEVALKHFYEWIFEQKPIPINYRYTVYCTTLRKESQNYWHHLWFTYILATVTTDKLVILKALGCSTDKANLETLLTTAITPDSDIRYQDSEDVFSSVYDSSLVGLIYTMEFIGDNHLQMLEYYGDDRKFENIINGISQTLSTPDLVTRFEKMINKISKNKPLLAQSMGTYIGQAHYELIWYNTHMPKIYEWLDTKYQPDIYRLPKTMRPVKYNIFIKPVQFEVKENFDGEVRIDIDVIKNTSSIAMNAASLNIRNVKIILSKAGNSRPVNVLNYILKNKTEQLEIYLDEVLSSGDHVTAIIKYIGNYSNSLKGFYRTSYHDAHGDTQWMVSTQFSPIYARRAFPCFDEPEYKAQFSISIERTLGYNTVSNMPLIKHKISHGDRIIDIYSPSETMSTYTVAFVVSKFEFDFIGKINNDKEIKLGGRPDMFKCINNIAAHHPENALKYLEKFTKIRYSLPKLDLVGVPELSLGGMENWGIAIFREDALFSKADTSAYNEQYKRNIILHKLTNMWFGNLVTLHWWESTWLNEGFAEYFQWLISNETNPSNWQSLDQFVVNSLQPALLYDGAINTHAMTYAVETPSEIVKVFDPIESMKAASVIRMFHHSFGDNAFSKAIFKYLSSHQHSHASPQDLFNAFKNVISSNYKIQLKRPPIEKIMASWTNQPGYPLVQATMKGQYLSLEQSRYTYSNQTFKNIVYEIPITLTTQAFPNFLTSGIIMWLGSEPFSTLLYLNDGWYIINIQQIGYYRVNYDIDNWLKLINYLKYENFKVIHSTNRAQIIDDILNLARTKHVNYTTALDATVYLVQEKDYLPWRAFFNDMTFLADRFNRISKRNVFANYIVELTQNLFRSIDFNNLSKKSHTDQLLAADVSKWSCKYLNMECVNVALALFASWRINKSNKIDPNFKPAVYCTAIEHGGRKDWLYLWNQYKIERILSEKQIILQALMCTRSSHQLIFCLEEAIEGKTIDKFYINDMFKFACEAPDGLDIVLDYMITNYNKIYDSTGTWDTVENIISVIASKISFHEQYLKLLKLVNKIFKDEELSEEIQRSLQISLQNAQINYEWFYYNMNEVKEGLYTITDSIRKFKLPISSGATRQLQNFSWFSFFSLIVYILYH
ncbi:uncharacterized protein [Prorops nasuta]|uniref:uncharacterized protein n=1 Tax=Prorops nasuta TaxID=863751 RepID=UPI0034CF62CF